MAYKLPIGFFAYPSSPPMLPETVRAAVEKINKTKQVHITTWEEARVGGKGIINEILNAIDASDFVVADLTGLNLNVLFEVGYAIAKNKRVWPTLDTSIGGIEFNELRTLTTVGYARYSSSSDIASAFLRERPYEDLNATILNTLISPNLSAGPTPTLLYLKSQFDTDASIQITKRLTEAPIKQIIDDPRESPAQTLTWYGQQVYAAEAVVCHLTSPSRQGSSTRNARYALVAGMAHGMGKRVLMIAEGDYLAPLDYRDMLRQYQTASAARRHLDAWIQPLEDNWRANRQSKEALSSRIRLATELKGLQLGEYIAENEGERLVDGYFIETAAYREALAGTTHTIFVGRKGTGKSANFLQLSARLQADARNILSVIKPVAYELEAILKILRGYSDRDRKGYVIESLWKFLLYSDVANALAHKLSPRVTAALSVEESAFLDFFQLHQTLLSGDFSTRLERCVAVLEEQASEESAKAEVEDFRRSISEVLHSGFLRDLRMHLVSALARGSRVALVIDNLDKAWDRQNDLHSLAEFLLGLLGAANKVRQEIKKDAKTDLDVSLAVFLRADIFEKVQEVAREPDKIKYTRLTWTDPEMLYNLIEERFAASKGDGVPRDALWHQFFCPSVESIPTKAYLAQSVLPRPRDFLFLVMTSVATAINRAHSRVEQADVMSARVDYAEFAFGILVIEDTSQDGIMEKVLYEFVGAPAEVMHSEVLVRLTKAGVPAARMPSVIEQLCARSFLGVEVGKGDFRFPDNSVEAKKVAVLARQLCETRNAEPTYQIHRAFRPFLETVESNKD
jgi:hypothetical protein